MLAAVYEGDKVTVSNITVPPDAIESRVYRVVREGYEIPSTQRGVRIDRPAKLVLLKRLKHGWIDDELRTEGEM